MSNIKKQYQELFELLDSNKNKKVSSVMPQLIELMSAKQSRCNFIKDDEGNVTHVFCYYHKEWEDISQAEYGKKANTASGLSSMCKEGVRQWNAQQKAIKSLKDSALEMVMNGELDAKDVADWVTKNEKELRVITPREDGHVAEV